ncbi:MAG: hypothetical protein HQK56_21215 [Deltaproteobacteria bacterium]|nr:hypothetical protein [Deltaproteobacteria bacterium]
MLDTVTVESDIEPQVYEKVRMITIQTDEYKKVFPLAPSKRVYITVRDNPNSIEKGEKIIIINPKAK